MKKKFLVASAVSIMFLAFTSSAAAFWPFDSGGGQVKGDETTVTNTNGGFWGVVQSFIHRFQGPAPTNVMHYPITGPSGATGVVSGFAPTGVTEFMGMIGDPKVRLDAAVAAGKITQAQETYILNQLATIRAKQQELMQLQNAFQQWLKTNNIPTSLFGEPPHVMPYHGPTGASGIMPPKPYHTEPAGGSSVTTQTHE